MVTQQEVVAENQLAVIVKDSGLETTKAQYILDKFQDYFKIAAEWEEKAKTIKVTDASQTVDMQIARTGRLFLRDKRIAIEKARKELKEQALREGKAIDGIANVLKALIVPIEEYLDAQEHFVEREAQRRAAEEAEAMRFKAEQERIAREEAERKEQERIRKENKRLQKEAEAREKKIAAERKAAEKKQRELEEKARKEREAAERAAKEAQAKAEAERRAIEEKARKERERQEKIIAEQRAKSDAERREREAAERKAREEKAALEARLAAQIECPKCHHKFTPGE